MAARVLYPIGRKNSSKSREAKGRAVSRQAT